MTYCIHTELITRNRIGFNTSKWIWLNIDYIGTLWPHTQWYYTEIMDNRITGITGITGNSIQNDIVQN